MTLSGHKSDRNSAVQRKGSRPGVGRPLFLRRLMCAAVSSGWQVAGGGDADRGRREAKVSRRAIREVTATGGERHHCAQWPQQVRLGRRSGRLDDLPC